MILDKQEILDYLREIKPELEAEGIKTLGLFGSYAKDKAREDSDIDICLDHTEKFQEKHPDSKYFLCIWDLEERLSNFFGKEVQITDFTDENNKEKYLKGVIYV